MLILRLLFYFFLSISPPLSSSSKKGFSIELIHRDSPNSPFYNPNQNSTERIHASVHRSIARASHLSTNNIIESTITSAGGEYLISLNIGTPPFNIMAIADTGSDLTWTQCKPCVSCYEQNAPIYDSSKSSTFAYLSCHSRGCLRLPEGGCDTTSRCKYTYMYGDNSTTTGFLSSETFYIGSMPIPNVVFGCSYDNRGIYDASAAGIIGLGGGPLSIVSQLGSSIGYKFSYCMVPSGSKEAGKINFGDHADVGPLAVSTPIVTSNTFYTLALESISVAGENVQAVRTRGDGAGNMIIDSGATLTVLDEGMLRSLSDKIAKAVRYPRTWDFGHKFDLCFDISGVESVQLPDMTFHFSGAAVVLKPLNTFVAVRKNVLCLGIVTNRGLGGLQVFGNVAQQNMHVGYDLKNMKVSIVPADCSKM